MSPVGVPVVLIAETDPDVAARYRRHLAADSTGRVTTDGNDGPAKLDAMRAQLADTMGGVANDEDFITAIRRLSGR
jgi:hypothetical protein